MLTTLNILPFAPNRVLRLYLGGAGIDRLCGVEPPTDNRFPENWIGSCIEGNGRAYHSPGHGISKVLFQGVLFSFPELLEKYGRELLGEKHLRKYGAIPAVLVKLLDSAEQLPLQIHPTKQDAKKYLNSDYGKTEAWLVLGTREVNGEKPYLLVGFNEKLDPQIFTKESLDGCFDKSNEMLNKIEVAPGDVVIIRGGVPHAIGPGITMVEVMEPSDHVIIPEKFCCGVELNEKQRFMGIEPETAMMMADFTANSPADIRRKYFTCPQVLKETADGTWRHLISPQDCELFSVEELTVNGSWQFDNPDSFGIGIVVEGSLRFDDVEVNSGGNFFLPFSVKQLNISGKGRVMFVRPPMA